MGMLSNYFRIYLSSPAEFWRDNVYGGWATAIALMLVLVWQLKKSLRSVFSSGSSSFPANVAESTNCSSGVSEIVSNADLKKLIKDLDESLDDSERWGNVIDKRNNLLSYRAKCCKNKDEPLKYISSTVFENCSAELLRDFYMDNDYRKKWDKTIVYHEQLQIDETNGIEIGHTIKKFPLLTPREYVSAWRLWEGEHKTFYCFIKECEHPSAPRKKKYVRVRFFRSGWRIRNVPGKNACEIKMVHQEDAGLNVEMAKLAFAKGIWSYVCKMDCALRKYSAINNIQTSSALTAVNLIQKVPPGLDGLNCNVNPTCVVPSTSCATGGQIPQESNGRKLARRPSRKMVANGMLLLGGLVCLSRGHSSLGAKVAMAYLLTKLNKRRQAYRETQDT